MTSLEYRLHPVSEVLGGMLYYRCDDQAAALLRYYRDLCATLPDEAEAYAALLTSPDGARLAALLLGYNGPVAEGEKVLAPARAFGKPIADLVVPMPHAARQSMLDDPGAKNGLHRYWRSAYVDHLPDEFIDLLVKAAATFTSPLSSFFYSFSMAPPQGCPPPPPPPPMPPADRFWDFDAVGQWTDAAKSASHIAWVREVWGRLQPHLLGSVYINHMAADDRPETVRASYGENYARLRELKAAYDPTNLFRVNSNITPA